MMYNRSLVFVFVLILTAGCGADCPQTKCVAPIVEVVVVSRGTGDALMDVTAQASVGKNDFQFVDCPTGEVGCKALYYDAAAYTVMHITVAADYYRSATMDVVPAEDECGGAVTKRWEVALSSHETGQEAVFSQEPDVAHCQ